MKDAGAEDVRYESVSQVLVSDLPELDPAYREYVDWWGDGEPGPHNIFDEILSPYIDELVRIGNNDALVSVFRLIEKLALSSDPRVVGLVTVSLCEGFVSDKTKLRLLKTFMGPLTRAQCDAVGRFPSSLSD
jgi:hypothetical protein